MQARLALGHEPDARAALVGVGDEAAVDGGAAHLGLLRALPAVRVAEHELELGLDRAKLVRLAYLLGSDYTECLPGVGPVVAMELLSEFPGEDGLHKFKAWWTKVQSGRDRPEESATSFRKRFVSVFVAMLDCGAIG